MVLSRPRWELVHGPDRSHDTLYSIPFLRLRDATKVAKALPTDKCWRVLKITGGVDYTAHMVTEKMRGGPDEVSRLQRERFQAQYLTARG